MSTDDNPVFIIYLPIQRPVSLFGHAALAKPPLYSAFGWRSAGLQAAYSGRST